jgi:dipeptidase
MCDTLVALGSATTDGVTIFGKNSDRDPNEAHHLVRIPRSTHPSGTKVQCTYIEIPQVSDTYEVFLAKPYWIWGAEMGANEHGVTIGNEAVFSKVSYGKEPGLIGMDFIRLALERAKTAREALDVITSLLAEYGQSGNCCLRTLLYYHNSFIIADPNDAWVLETVAKHWLAEQVRDIRAISNRLSIGSTWDLASDDVVDYAIERGWCKSRDDFHFAQCYSDFIYTTFSYSRPRLERTTALLNGHRGAIDVGAIMQILRDHGPNPGPDWRPTYGITGCDVCAHAGFGPIRISQSTGSMVSHLAPDVQTHFVTGTSAPCTGIFKPVWLGAPLPDTGPEPTGTYDEATLWWRHEALHRATLRDYAARKALFEDERDSLEARFVEEAMALRGRSQQKRAAFSEQCFAEADEAEAQWMGKVSASGGPTRQGPFYALAWRNLDREAMMPDGQGGE